MRENAQLQNESMDDYIARLISYEKEDAEFGELVQKNNHRIIKKWLKPMKAKKRRKQNPEFLRICMQNLTVQS